MNNVRNLSFIGICMAFVVIALGAWTRLVDAGLGCPDWPGCYGFVFWPNDEAEIALAESRFPMFPYVFSICSYTFPGCALIFPMCVLYLLYDFL